MYPQYRLKMMAESAIFAIMDKWDMDIWASEKFDEYELAQYEPCFQAAQMADEVAMNAALTDALSSLRQHLEYHEFQVTRDVKRDALKALANLCSKLRNR